MKKKLSRILGVALALAMVIALAVMLLPAASTQTTEAAPGTLRFGLIPLPRFGAVGKYVLTPDTHVGPIAVTPQGNTLFAAANITDVSTMNVNTVLKSSDDGYTWTLQTAFRAAATAIADNTSIVDIVTSPEYSTDSTLYVATDNLVYQSVDGGTAFTAMAREWAVGENITGLDVTLDSGGRLSVIVGTTAAGNAGEVYVYSPATTGMNWQAQTIGARNVLAVAFSPNFAGDEGILAVCVDGTDTRTRFAFGSTQTGGGWGTSIGDGLFVDSQANTFVSTRASIAFPDDFDVDGLTTNIAFVGLSANTTNTANEQGDVYEVIFQPGALSTTVDLNVRGLISAIRTATNIHSIDVTGDAEAATVLVGTDLWSTGATVGVYYWTSYISTDSGVTWTTARNKSPTGGTATRDAPAWAWDAAAAGVLTAGADVNCYVLLSPDFATSGVIYAATDGADTSAFSRSTDGGASFNQISFIDYSTTTDNYSVYNITASEDHQTILLSTYLTLDPIIGAAAVTGGSLWKTTNGGANWDRIWSYANPTATGGAGGAHQRAVYVPTAIFAMDLYNGKLWRSTDDGTTFPRLVTAKRTTMADAPGLPTFANLGLHVWILPLTDAMLWSWGWDNTIWYTENLGRPWTDPDESIITGAPKEPVFAGSLYMWGTFGGTVFVSDDEGVTYTKTLGTADAGGGGATISLLVDENYEENHYVYAARDAAGGGIWRIEVDEEDPESTEWERIDIYSANYTEIRPTKITMMDGVYYVIDSSNVTAGVTGGIWRSVNADADLTGANPPVFTIVNTGLNADDIVGYKTLTSNPTTIWVTNSSVNALYNNVLLAYKDTLSAAVTLEGPDDAVSEAGMRLSTTDLTQTVILSWGAVSGAQEYRLDVCNDEACDSVAQTFTTEGQEQRVDGLIPGKTYYWRVRVNTPITSPWSGVRSFTVAEAVIEAPEVVVEFDVVSPGRGESGVPVQPVFVWSEVEGAESYELVVAEDKTFAIIEWSHTADTSFYQGDEVLAYGTTYYWRVRAAGGEWANGVFTTAAKAVEEEPAVVIEKEPAPPPEIVEIEVPGAAAAIPSYLLWTIIGVGAVLIIALIVLIVRTRRVT